MVLHLPAARVAVIREYAEAFDLLIHGAAASLRPPARAALLHHALTVTRALGVGAPPQVNGWTHATLTEALHALQAVGAHLERLRHARALTPHRHALIAPLHATLHGAVESLLHARR